MTHRMFALAAIVLAAGCGSQERVELENVSLEDAAERARSEIRLQPGQWQTVARIGDLSLPGAPPAMQQALAQSISRTNTATDCITPEEAANPSAQMLAGQSGECRYDRFRMSGGTMDAAMTCTQPGDAGTMRATLTGKYSPTDYAVDMAMRVAVPGMPGGEEMTMNATITGRRLGECRG